MIFFGTKIEKMFLFGKHCKNQIQGWQQVAFALVTHTVINLLNSKKNPKFTAKTPPDNHGCNRSTQNVIVYIDTI